MIANYLIGLAAFLYLGAVLEEKWDLSGWDTVYLAIGLIVVLELYAWTDRKGYRDCN